MKGGKALAMGNAPFAFDKRTTSSLMWGVSLALLPALAWGIFCFGASAAIVVCASILGALVGEAASSALRRRFTLWDGSAFLTGLLVGMAMPPEISPFIPAAAAFFATAVVKGAFGGLGSNWMNPALAGVAFALVNWPAEMSSWTFPRQLEGLASVSGATPLGLARSQGGGLASGFASSIDSSVTDALNHGLFSRLGADLPGGYVDLAIGNKAGSLGELSGLLILLASILLLSRKVIRWEIPCAIVASFALLTWAFGGLPLGDGFFSGDVLLAILSGSFLLVAFFMAPDPVTSPSSRLGMAIYGVGIGSITFLLRLFGSRSEGTAFAVILMDCAVPALSKLDATIARLRASRTLAGASAEVHAKEQAGRSGAL
jgi:Na+-translocating ferredoxin:NAD+ oxidoreductase subunit D